MIETAHCENAAATGIFNITPTMNFKILDQFPEPELEAAWRECMTRAEMPSCYDAPEFFLEPYWAQSKRFAVLAVEGKSVRGVLTGLHIGDEVSCGMPSRPQICLDMTADIPAVLEQLADGLLAQAAGAKVLSVYTWPSLEFGALRARGFRYRELPGNVVLDLTRGPEALFKEFTKDRRRNIRFAEKNGVQVSEATTLEHVAEAYEVYLHWRKTQRKQVKGDQSTLQTWETAFQLPGHKLFLARAGGKTIAINKFRFFPGGLFESAANNSLDEFLHLKPNELLQWKGIEWACHAGMRRHSLGASHEFLRRFGGVIIPISRYRLDRSWLRRSDLQETAGEVGRRVLRDLPTPIQGTVRRIFKRK